MLYILFRNFYKVLHSFSMRLGLHTGIEHFLFFPSVDIDLYYFSEIRKYNEKFSLTALLFK